MSSVDDPDGTAKEGDDTPPVAYARAERAKYGTWRLVVDDCPLCHERHTHGGGAAGGPHYGLRLAGCRTREIRGYQLRPAVAS